jgi:hypothetical protein
MKLTGKRFATTRRLIASLLLAIMSTASAYATCATDICLGPCTYEELLVDTKFSGNCGEWVRSNNVNLSRVQNGSNWLYELRGSGYLTQNVITNTYSSMDIGFDCFIIKTNPGTERLYVEITRGTTVLETVAVIYPNATQTDYGMYIANYSDDVITVRFRYEPGSAPGDTKFRIDNAVLFGNF